MPPPRSARGQASVELVALLPLIAAGLMACIQVVLVAYAAWSAHAAARSAARAAAVGADALAAARRSLPPSLEHRVSVGAPDGSGRVAVRVRVPSVVPALALGAITAHAGFPSQR
jgi:TadE-like protein